MKVLGNSKFIPYCCSSFSHIKSAVFSTVILNKNHYGRLTMEVEMIFFCFLVCIRLAVPVTMMINQQSNQYLLLGDHSGPINYKAWLGLR